MTTDELLAEIKSRGFARVEAKDFHAMFPGRSLTKDEIDFKTSFAILAKQFDVVDGKVSLRNYNPNGTSQHDVLMAFCHKNQVQFRWGKSRCVFWRGMVSPMLLQIFAEEGEVEGVPFKSNEAPVSFPNRKPPSDSVD